MLKWIIILLLLMPIMNAITIEYSPDNLTNWKNITSLDEVGKNGFQLYLQENTIYYFRAKNDTAIEWQYLSQETKVGGIFKMEFFNLAVFGFFFLLSILFVILSHKYKDEGKSAMVYSIFGAAICFILFAILLGGFEVIQGVTFIIDVNYYLGGLVLLLGVYCTMIAMTFYGDTKQGNQYE